MSTTSPYPEHDKMALVAADSETIGQFLDDSEYILAEYREVDGFMDPQLVPVQMSIEQVLADYFEIDLKKVEAEKRRMLAEVLENLER